jgi:hypothetical protein
MSKKNNKNRSKAYAEFLKDEERKIQEKRLKKQDKRDANRITNEIADEINDMTLQLEKGEKMQIEKSQSKKKVKIFAKKQKRY